MRMSCNGCRVLRKGCSDDCSIRPCLQWIKNPEAQANATVFLAKFYGRAGLMNLINAGPENLRPAIFRSLLYEACGRMVNPIYGSVGLLWSGSWQLCQDAVEAVLRGAPIMQIPCETAATVRAPPLHKACSYDIRHVSKEDADDLHHKLKRAARTRLKRLGDHCCEATGSDPTEAKRQCRPVATTSHESTASHASEPGSPGGAAAVPYDGDCRDNETTFSMETVEATSMVTSHGASETAKPDCRAAGDSEVELELTLGFDPVHHGHSPQSSNNRSRGHSPSCSSSHSAATEPPKRCDPISKVEGVGGDVLRMGLRLGLSS